MIASVRLVFDLFNNIHLTLAPNGLSHLGFIKSRVTIKDNQE